MNNNYLMTTTRLPLFSPSSPDIFVVMHLPFFMYSCRHVCSFTGLINFWNPSSHSHRLFTSYSKEDTFFIFSIFFILYNVKAHHTAATLAQHQISQPQSKAYPNEPPPTHRLTFKVNLVSKGIHNFSLFISSLKFHEKNSPPKR